MSKNNNLGELIESMSKSDKRYFRLSSEMHKGNKQYVDIFDIVENEKDKGREHLKSKLKQKSVIKHLPVMKTYLYKAILDSMHIRCDEATIDFKLYKIIHQIGILYDKGLYLHALALIDKAKKKAWLHEQIEILPEILKWELNIHHLVLYTPELASVVLDEHKKVLSILSNLYHYKALNTQLFIHVHQFGIARNKKQMAIIEKFMKQPLLKEKKSLSVMAEFSFYMTWSMYYRAKSNIRENYKIVKKQVSLLENNKEIFVDREMRYVQVLNNLLLSQRMLGKYNDAMETIEKLKTIKSSSEQVKAHIFFSVYYNKLNLYIDAAMFKEGFSIIQETEEEMKKIKIMPYEHRIALYSAMAYICFGAERYHKTLQFVKAIIDNYKEGIRQDIHASARVLYLITRYETEPTDTFLENITKSAHYFLKTRKLLYETEMLMINFFFKIVKSKKNIPGEFIKLRTDIKRVFAKHPEEEISLLAFDFMSWVDSQITKRPFAQIIREKHASLFPGKESVLKPQ